MTTWVRGALVLSGLWAVMTLPMAIGAQLQSEHPETKESMPRFASNGESDRDLILLDPLENPNESEGRLVILPEIKR